MDYNSHPQYRVRGEGSKNALKNKSGGSWFAHDEPQPDIFDPPPNNYNIYNNYNNHVDENEVNENHAYSKRFNSDEINKTREKIHGPNGEIDWYNHENNRNYRPPIKERLRSEYATEIKKKNGQETRNGMIERNNNEFSRSGANRKDVMKNKDRIRGNHQTPRWFKHPDEEEDYDDAGAYEDELIQAPKTRLTTEDAIEYKDRNVGGSRGEYVIHPEAEKIEEEAIGDRWRPESRVGMHPRSESECWFHHNDNVDDVRAHVPRNCPSSVAKETYEKSRGLTMLSIFQHESEKTSNQSTVESVNKSSTGGLLDNQGHSYHLARPYQQHFLNKTHQNNSEGMMKMVMNQNENVTFKEPINYARAVKPEAQVWSNKNKGGIMAECMTGYPDRPYEKHIHRTANVKQEFLAKQKGSHMALAIKGNLPITARNVPLRAVKPEAVVNALRARGSMNNLFQTNDAHTERSDSKQPRLRSAEARAIARRYQYGSVNNLIF